MKVGIVDWGGGNLASVERALRHVGAETLLSSSAEALAACDRLVFPGVGAFGDVMQGLRRGALDRVILDAVSSRRPLLGICVGMQALLERSEENPETPGLGLLRGTVRRFPASCPKVPQIGWNRVEPAGGGAGGVVADGHYYFVNSYFPDPEDRSVAAGWTDYHGRFLSALSWGPVTATQFHPEKSGGAGLGLVSRWLAAG